MTRWLAFILFFIAVSAAAQTNERVLATELFNKGRELFASGDVAAAWAKFAESARLDPKVGTLARLAECEEKLGQLVAARGHWQQSLNIARADHDERADHVERELARLDAIVPKLRLVVAGAEPEGLEIVIDGTRVRAGALGVALPVDAGVHVVSATATKRKPWSTTVQTAFDGRTTDVAIELVAEEPPPSPPVRIVVAAPPRPVIRAHPPTAMRVAAATTFGIGLVGVGLGTAFAVDAVSKRDASNAPGGCDANNLCPPEAANLRNAARDSGTLATGFFIAGGVTAAAGVVLWLVAPRFASRTTVTALASERAWGFAILTQF